MGAGLAKQFADRFPDMYTDYVEVCALGLLDIGDLHVYQIVENCPFPHPSYIINFPTKKKWENPSKIEYIEAGLTKLDEKCRFLKIFRVALPKLGCGLGGLKWEDVGELIHKQLSGSDIEYILCIRP